MLGKQYREIPGRFGMCLFLTCVSLAVGVAWDIWLSWFKGDKNEYSEFSGELKFATVRI